MEIKILGSGCSKCKKVFNVVNEVIKEQKIEANIEKIEDMMEIISYNVMSTPAIVIDGKVVLCGIIPSKEKILELLNA